MKPFNADRIIKYLCNKCRREIDVKVDISCRRTQHLHAKVLEGAFIEGVVFQGKHYCWDCIDKIKEEA